jgi:Catalase
MTRSVPRNHRLLLCAAALTALTQAACAATAVVPPNAEGEVIPTDEAAAIGFVSDAIKASVQAGFDKNGRAFRDAHRKAHGCVAAKFTVLDKLPAKVAQGLFATPKAYNAVVRFSNGSGSDADDRSPDGRGMAIKVMGVSGMKLMDDEPTASTQDFVMINHPVFFVRNAADYVGFQKAAGGAGLGLTGWLAGHVFHETPIIIATGTKRITNPLSSRYWSMTPYKLGTEQMKYSAKPCAGGSFVDSPRSPNYLGDGLKATLAAGSACFEFMVQTRAVPAKMPIEDPTIEWKESLSPFVTVARVEIGSQTPEAAETCEARSYTPWHAIAEHRPLGGISRVRKAVYQTVSTLRHQLNGQPRIEP